MPRMPFIIEYRTSKTDKWNQVPGTGDFRSTAPAIARVVELKNSAESLLNVVQRSTRSYDVGNRAPQYRVAMATNKTKA